MWRKAPSKWARMHKDLPLFTPGIGAGGTRVYVGGFTNGTFGIQAFDLNGNKVWTTAAEGLDGVPLRTAPAPVTTAPAACDPNRFASAGCNGLVYVSTVSHLYALDDKNGCLAWSQSLPYGYATLFESKGPMSQNFLSDPVISPDGEQVFVMENGFLYAFSAKDGLPSWAFPALRVGYVAYPEGLLAATIEDGSTVLFIGTTAETFEDAVDVRPDQCDPSVGCDCSNGCKEWHVSKTNGELLAISATTGERLWSYPMMAISARPAISPDGTMLFVTHTDCAGQTYPRRCKVKMAALNVMNGGLPA